MIIAFSFARWNAFAAASRCAEIAGRLLLRHERVVQLHQIAHESLDLVLDLPLPRRPRGRADRERADPLVDAEAEVSPRVGAVQRGGACLAPVLRCIHPKEIRGGFRVGQAP
ncbi:MAG: hypothetical protein ABMB14_23280 [Myxococcota bacterium]